MENFIIEKELGRGAYSVVYLVRRKIDQQKYALKQTSLANLEQADKNRAFNEVRIMASLRHPNILRYKECFLDEQISLLSVVTEYAQKGDLAKKIKYYQKQLGTKIPQEEIWRILTDVARGIQCLHRNNILHRDIKPANILEGASGYKLADLNTSKVMKNRGPLIQTQIGTPFYAPPQTWKDQQYSQKCDIWSLGVVMYELISLKLPFPARDKSELHNKILLTEPASLNPVYTEFLRKLVMSMLAKNQQDRPSIWTVLQHCEIYARIQKQTEQSKLPSLLDTIQFHDDDDINWKNNLPPPRFSPCKNQKEELGFKKSNSNYDAQCSKLPSFIKKISQNSGSQQRDSRQNGWKYNKPGIPPKNKVYQQPPTPQSSRKDSRNNSQSFKENLGGVPLQSKQKSFSIRHNTPKKKLPSIATDRNSNSNKLR